MKNVLKFGFAALLIIVPSTFAHADHAWGNYHWARKANPFTLRLGDNVTSAWDAYLRSAATDWSQSSILDVSVVFSGKNAKTCRPTLGRGEVCNAKYGANGWLGIAQIWVLGEHISQGTVRLNDTYFSTATYNKPEWRNFVMCQEVGHLFGLDHQDEDFSNPNLGTCMDYTSNALSNQHPNQHDFDMLETMYAHLDTTTTVAQTSGAAKGANISDDPREWGREIRNVRSVRSSTFERDLGAGQKIITHVFWAEGDANHDEHDDSHHELRGR
jgi:hypothetical protein